MLTGREARDCVRLCDEPAFAGAADQALQQQGVCAMRMSAAGSNDAANAVKLRRTTARGKLRTDIVGLIVVLDPTTSVVAL